MSKENEWEDDPDMQKFLEWADQPGPWDEEDDKIHTVGGLTNDKENGFMSFVNKTKMSKETIIDKEKKEQAIEFAVFVSNDTAFDDFCFMSKEHQERIYQEFLNQNKDE